MMFKSAAALLFLASPAFGIDECQEKDLARYVSEVKDWSVLAPLLPPTPPPTAPPASTPAAAAPVPSSGLIPVGGGLGGGEVTHDQVANAVNSDGQLEVLTMGTGRRSNGKLGSQNFAKSLEKGIVFRDLNRNDMVLSSLDLDGDFTVTGAFLVDYPDVEYQVTCTANSDICQIVEIEPQIEHCLLKDGTIPDECLDQDYDMNLYVIEGPHFLLGVSTEGNCPNVALTSIEGAKKKILFSPSANNSNPSYSFDKKVTLRDFLKAEEETPATDDKGFDLESNTCVHYAMSIWRNLGYPETPELAQFVVSNVANDPKFEDIAKARVSGLRYLTAKVIGGKRAMQSYLEEVVYSQMIIE